MKSFTVLNVRMKNEMSKNYELDDECQKCAGTCDFKSESISGHTKKHRTSTCRDCGTFTILVDCIGC